MTTIERKIKQKIIELESLIQKSRDSNIAQDKTEHEQRVCWLNQIRVLKEVLK